VSHWELRISGMTPIQSLGVCIPISNFIPCLYEYFDKSIYKCYGILWEPIKIPIYAGLQPG